jgi:glycine hydroxymethyltransferase
MDTSINHLIQQELTRQRDGLEMIPSENFASVDVLSALGSILTNKYSEGYPGKRYYGGNQFIDEVENLARDRAKLLFGVEHANVQPYSGSPANHAVYMALLNPGDTVLGLSLPHGGHLTHGWKVSFAGKYYHAVAYELHPETHRLDYDAIRELAQKNKPKLIICGATAYPRIIDFKKFREIADEVGAYLLADISHIAGLIVAGEHPSPVPYADVIMSTTHKTLRGPRGAMILLPKIADRFGVVDEKGKTKTLAQKIDSAVFPGLQGGPHNHQTAAIAVALGEALEPSFKTYGTQIVANAKKLAELLVQRGFNLITGGTDNHLLLIDLRNKNITGADAEHLLDSVGITVNKNTIPFDPNPPLRPSGIRLGTPALTTRGFTETDMEVVASCIADTLDHPQDSAVHQDVILRIKTLTNKYPLYPQL